MFDRWKLGVFTCVGLVLITLALTSLGCGDNRPKITRPDNPTSVPDESMRLSTDSSHAPPPQPTKRGN
ncbi:hypothetical protein [Aeoliella sp.]|uniref:hypothetical protein n=1 Tax=Aeoliella sp. TaxID=2795800 RepID=UPI003CCC1324